MRHRLLLAVMLACSAGLIACNRETPSTPELTGPAPSTSSQPGDVGHEVKEPARHWPTGSWSIFSMYQESGNFWWKRIKDGYTSEGCRVEVLKATHRDFVGLVQWYHFPTPGDGKAPEWLKDVIDAKPEGGVPPWVGCIPTELNPAKEKQT